MSKKLSAKTIYTLLFLLLPFISFCQDSEDYIVHTVKPGEVPAVLSKKYNVPLPELTSLNKWGAKVVLHVGDKVKLPLTAHLNPAGDSAAAIPAVVKAPAAAGAGEAEGRGVPLSLHIQAKQPAADTSNYTLHTIERGEVPSVLAKKYNVNVDELKRINNWNPKVIWHIGDKVKLPRGKVTAAPADTVKTAVQPSPKENVPPVSRPVADTTAPVAAPAAQVNYTVNKKETLYSISKKFKITVAQLKNWNRLSNDNISEGQILVLYTTKPVIKSTADTATTPAILVTPAPAPFKPQAVKDSGTALQPATFVHKPAGDSAVAAIPAEGYFTPMFGKDINGRTLTTVNGVAMTFKTASGWTDKKYYVLMNDVPPGSFVKITNAGGKSVYAKILWNMGDAQDNEGLNFRISDAAAAALGLKDTKFQVTISYYK